MENLPYNDQAISVPSEDRFGIDPFARALASSIRKLKSPTGSVIAVNGPWGSGKSSAANLVRHHLAEGVKNQELELIDFACWWFRGEEALALAFFRELYAGLVPSLGEKIKKALPKLGARLLRAGSVLGGAADAAGAGGMGAVTGSALNWLGGLIEQDESVEKLHRELATALAGQTKRFLIVIDDIDRLSPDEALLIFRLVKSVGRLPNVMYLLVYDRQLAEKIVSERYPSEGPHYLEKIVQAAFELPEPSAIDLQQHLLASIEAICGAPPEASIVRFMNMFHEGVAPAMRTPRDVARLANSLSVTWPAVSGEVDLADFLTLEVFRLFHPSIYRAIRRNKELLSGVGRSAGLDREANARRHREIVFGSDATSENHLTRVLMRLFPALESAWSNMSYGDDFERGWAMERRACSATHFDSYFRFAVGDEALPRSELEEIIARAGEHEYVVRVMRQAATIRRRAGGTKAALILAELNTHAQRVQTADISPLLGALFEVADEINVEADEAKAFGIGNNHLRLHWLLRRLTLERMALFDRSAIILKSSDCAALGWLADLTRSAWGAYHRRDGEAPKPPDQCLTTEADAGRLRELLRIRLETAAKNATLAKHPNLASLLYWWSELAGDEGAAARDWTGKLQSTHCGVQQLAAAFTSYGWRQGLGFAGLGDLVAKRTVHVDLKGLGKFVELGAFRERVEEVAASAAAPKLSEFLEAWRRADQGEHE